MSSNPKCYFNYKTLTAKVGNYTKGYEELECIQVPTFKRTILEKESLKNGWYGTKQEVEKVYDYYFIILKHNKPFDVLYNPYGTNIKSDIISINANHPHPEILKFIEKLNNYKQY